VEVSPSYAFAESLKVVGFEGGGFPIARVEKFFGEICGFFGSGWCIGGTTGDCVGFAGD
jgi:hypothetical protein